MTEETGQERAARLEAFRERRNAELREALRVVAHPCPYCGAPAGEWCMRASGYLTITAHSARRRHSAQVAGVLTDRVRATVDNPVVMDPHGPVVMPVR